MWLSGSRAQAQVVVIQGSVALQHVGSSWTRDWTRVLCIGRQILYHWPTREVPYNDIFKGKFIIKQHVWIKNFLPEKSQFFWWKSKYLAIHGYSPMMSDCLYHLSWAFPFSVVSHMWPTSLIYSILLAPKDIWIHCFHCKLIVKPQFYER